MRGSFDSSSRKTRISAQDDGSLVWMTVLQVVADKYGDSGHAARSRMTSASMALQIDTIRAMAERVAASHHLEVVDVEFVGGGKARTLRVYLEKDAAERAALKNRLKESVANDESDGQDS